VEKETAMASSKRSPEKILGVIASIFLLSFAIVAITQGRSQLVFAQGQGENSMMNMSSSSPSILPQPNANGTLLKVEASNGLFEPASSWPVANPKQPLYFTFLVFQNVDAKWTSAADQ
jgi:hypothetical protein